MSQDLSIFVLEKLKLQAQRELEERVEKHLKSQFYDKILPTIVNNLKQNLIIELVNDNDDLELKIKIKSTTNRGEE